MTVLYSFPALVSDRSRILILGSMPGAASLAAGQYYAKKQNLFWPLMGSMFGAEPILPYADRTAILDAAGIALWDVLHSCTRLGSLDSNIRDPKVNDFESFFARYPAIGKVFFNGTRAKKLFHRHAKQILCESGRVFTSLPSTSPANRRIKNDQKVEAWALVKRSVLCE